HRDLVRIDLIVLGLATVDRFHVQRVPQNKRNIVLGAQIGEPIPSKDAFHANRHVFSVGGYRFKEQLRGTRHVSVQHDLALRIQDTDVHRSGMQIDSAVVSVLLSVKSHDEVSSFKSVFGKHEHTKWYAQEGASMSIIRLEADLRACSLRSPARPLSLIRYAKSKI